MKRLKGDLNFFLISVFLQYVISNLPNNRKTVFLLKLVIIRAHSLAKYDQKLLNCFPVVQYLTILNTLIYKMIKIVG